MPVNQSWCPPPCPVLGCLVVLVGGHQRIVGGIAWSMYLPCIVLLGILWKSEWNQHGCGNMTTSCVTAQVGFVTAKTSRKYELNLLATTSLASTRGHLFTSRTKYALKGQVSYPIVLAGLRQLIYSLFNLLSWWSVKDENIQLVLTLSEVALSISLTSGRSASSSSSPHHERYVVDSLDRSRQQESCCLLNPIRHQSPTTS